MSGDGPLGRLARLLGAERGLRWLAIATVSVFVASVASVGQVSSRRDDADGELVAGPSSGADGERVPGEAGSTETLPGDAGATASTVAGAQGANTPGGAQGPGGSTPGGPTPTFPSWGLRTQGVTDREVKLGISYNTTGCGDAGALQAALGASVTGDYEKSIDTYVRYVNDTGGIAGRKLKMVTADDGGGGCPEKAGAAARELVHDEKVFAVIPGLHEVSDYVASQRIPTFIGRDDPASLARIGPNGLGLIQEIEGNLTAWAAFGKNYLNSGAHKPCLIRPEKGVSGDWPLYESILLRKMADQGLKFTDIVEYKEDVATAQQQSSAAAARMKNAGCDQVYFMAGNPIALIFFTDAAEQAGWRPTWTFTSYMVLSDSDLAGGLMNQNQWENAVGLSTRVPPGEHPKDGNCVRIYKQYNGEDGQSGSATAQVACAAILTAAEMMRRGAALTGRLDADALLVGADAISNDFYYDSHVPVDWKFPAPPGPYKTKGFSHYTVVDWDSSARTYRFPEYPLYWKIMGPGRSGGEDLRPLFKNG